MRSSKLKIAGGIVSMVLVVSLYGNMRRKRKDKVASELLREVTRIIKPVTEGLLSEDAFDIYYMDEILQKAGGQVLTLKAGVAAAFAERIYNAWGAWYQGGDDEAKVYAVFRELKDKVQVSQVAKAYQTAYKENLIEKLGNKLEKSEVKTVLDIIRSLPAYRVL